MGLYFLFFFATGYWTAGLVLYADRMLRRVRVPFKRRMLKTALFDLVMGFLALIVKFGGR